MNYFIIVLRLNNDDPLELTLPLDSQPLQVQGPVD